MKNLPIADSILGGSLVNGNAFGAELLNETAIKRRPKGKRTNDDLDGRFLLEELGKGFQMLFVAVSQEVVAIAGARRLIAQERIQNEGGTPLWPAVDEPVVLSAGSVNANRVASGNGKNRNGCAVFAGKETFAQNSQNDGGARSDKNLFRARMRRERERCQGQIVKENTRQRRPWNLEPSQRQAGGSFASFDHNRHPKPSARVCQRRHCGRPCRHCQGKPSAGHHKRRQKKHQDKVDQQRNRREQIEIPHDESERAQPSNRGNSEATADIPNPLAGEPPPVRLMRFGNQFVIAKPRSAPIHQRSAKDDNRTNNHKRKLKARLENLKRVPKQKKQSGRSNGIERLRRPLPHPAEKNYASHRGCPHRGSGKTSHRSVKPKAGNAYHSHPAPRNPATFSRQRQHSGHQHHVQAANRKDVKSAGLNERFAQLVRQSGAPTENHCPNELRRFVSAGLSNGQRPSRPILKTRGKRPRRHRFQKTRLRIPIPNRHHIGNALIAENLAEIELPFHQRLPGRGEDSRQPNPLTPMNARHWRLVDLDADASTGLLPARLQTDARNLQVQLSLNPLARCGVEDSALRTRNNDAFYFAKPGALADEETKIVRKPYRRVMPVKKPAQQQHSAGDSKQARRQTNGQHCAKKNSQSAGQKPRIQNEFPGKDAKNQQGGEKRAGTPANFQFEREFCAFSRHIAGSGWMFKKKPRSADERSNKSQTGDDRRRLTLPSQAFVSMDSRVRWLGS